MIEIFATMFSYTFLTRAVLVGSLVALCASLLGVSLVLKRYAMIGDGLSHVGFGTLAIATAMHWAPLEVTVPVVIFTAFLLLRLSDNSKIKGDAAIAMISTGALSVGILAASVSTGMNTDIYSYLFGSILALSPGDVKLSLLLSLVVLFLFFFFYHKMFAITFDENFARATGTKESLYNMLLATLTAITIVLGMRLMGALLISGLIIFPALSAMRLFKSFRGVVISAAVISVFCVFTGIVCSYIFSAPTGASIIVINVILFCLFSLVRTIRGSSK